MGKPTGFIEFTRELPGKNRWKKEFIITMNLLKNSVMKN